MIANNYTAGQPAGNISSTTSSEANKIAHSGH